jgi:hypothetical protein
MCEKCVEIDKKVKRYRDLLRSLTDQFSVDGAKTLIGDLEAQKALVALSGTSTASPHC